MRLLSSLRTAQEKFSGRYCVAKRLFSYCGYVCRYVCLGGRNVCQYSQTSVHERLGSRTIRFTNKCSEHKASRMTYCVSSYEHASRQNVEKKNHSGQIFSEAEAQWVLSRIEWCQEIGKRKTIPFQTITFHFLIIFHLRRQLSSIQVR